MYQFSVPMPYSKEDIDKILDINNQVQESKITSLYACVPRGCEVFTGFEQSRNFAFDNLSLNYWKNLIEYTLKKNCDFIYLLNSPKPLDIENPDFHVQLEKLDLLLNELRKIGANKLRVASAQLMSYIENNYFDFKIYASTSFEYKTIWEYQNFIAFHPTVKQIVPSHDCNKNFKLLSNITKRYPNIEIELMVNEACLQGCPNRVLHSMMSLDINKICVIDDVFSENYPTKLCVPVAYKYPIQQLVIGTNIFPWDIKEYSKIGITKFKFVGRDWYTNDFNYAKDNFYKYIKGVENINKIMTEDLSIFTHHLYYNKILQQLTVKDYKRYLPNINYFKKHGHLCASRCGVECRYCYKCAEKIQKVFEKKTREKEKQTHYVPTCVIEHL